MDNPPSNLFDDISDILSFIKKITEGFSCSTYARKCADKILKRSKSDVIVLLDGDKTLTMEDSSTVFGYSTNLYDGNFYTGYQTWKQKEEFRRYRIPDIKSMPVPLNRHICCRITKDSYILTSGHEEIWQYIAGELKIPFYGGSEMSAETKFYITKYLQEAGRKVEAYGDGMNDYFMLKQADAGYLVTKRDGSVSRSLKGRDMEGLIYV